MLGLDLRLPDDHHALNGEKLDVSATCSDGKERERQPKPILFPVDSMILSRNRIIQVSL